MGSNPMEVKQVPNREQLQAIEKFIGPSLVIAGAGTGKTSVLTEKIKRLVLEKNVRPENILALTFTDKAAFEMEERVDRALPYGFFQTWIMTFHGFADSLLHEFGMHIGLSPSYHLLSEAEAVMFFRKNLHHFQLDYFYSTGNPTGFIDSVLGHLSRLRDENISPRQYRQYADKLSKEAKLSKEEDKVEEANKTLELAQIYAVYQELKLKESYLDFGDLIYYLVSLLEKRKNILKEVQSRFSYGLVDEFQDTNIVQYTLIKLLFPPQSNPNLTLIGDDNQSIYKFRGASVSNILNFKEDYPKADIFVLNRNYRSYQEILDSAYQLIKFNNPDTLEVRLGINKELVANKGKSETALPVLLHGIDADSEGELIVAQIKELSKTKYRLNDFAILVRANEHAKPIIQSLERNGLPYQFLGPALLYFKNEIRDLIALLKFLNDSTDSASLYRVLSMPLIKIDKQQLVYLLSFGKRISRSLIEVLELLREHYEGVLTPELEKVRAYIPYLKAEDRDQFLKITNLLIKLLQKGARQSALQILYTFLEESGYLKTLSKISSVEDEEKLANITRFFNRLKKMTGDYGEVTVREALDNINLALELGDSPRAQDLDFKEENAVNILTAHSAKGLEFKVVFLSNLVVDRFPTRRRGDKLPIPEALIKEKLPEGNYHLQEERRLFYVGMTRAQDRLFLTYADLYPGGKRQRKLSTFVTEALGEARVKEVLSHENQLSQQLSIFETLRANPDLIKQPKLKGVKLQKSSYTQIETYERCPKQYQYRYLIKVPEPESSALSFGSSVHRALELFYKDIMEKRLVDLSTLLTHFKTSFIPLGYLSRTLQQRSLETGSKILTDYYEKFYDNSSEVYAVEKNFSLKLEFKDKEYFVGGKIDRIDKNGDLFEIIDYKTGKMPLERELKNSLQLGIYALAAMDQKFLNLSPEQITLTFFYLDKGEKFSLQAAKRNLEEVKSDVLEALLKMETGEYPPNSGHHCEWCPFKIICPAWGN